MIYLCCTSSFLLVLCCYFRSSCFSLFSLSSQLNPLFEYQTFVLETAYVLYTPYIHVFNLIYTTSSKIVQNSYLTNQRSALISNMSTGVPVFTVYLSNVRRTRHTQELPTYRVWCSFTAT